MSFCHRTIVHTVSVLQFRIKYHGNAMVPFNHISASRQTTRNHDLHCDISNNVKVRYITLITTKWNKCLSFMVFSQSEATINTKHRINTNMCVHSIISLFKICTISPITYAIVYNNAKDCFNLSISNQFTDVNNIEITSPYFNSSIFDLVCFITSNSCVYVYCIHHVFMICTIVTSHAAHFNPRSRYFI